MLNLNNKSVYLEYGFGDKWAATSFLLKESERLNKVIYFNCEDWQLIYEIANYLNHKGKIKYKKYPIIRPNYDIVFKTKPLKTKITYKKSSNIIAYQFDGRSDFYIKNSQPHEIQYFLKYTKALNYKTINVGNMQPLNFVINILAKCKLFVGVPSGITHVAMSVGTPIHCIFNNFDKNKLINSYHYKQNVKYYKNLMDFCNFLPKISLL